MMLDILEYLNLLSQYIVNLLVFVNSSSITGQTCPNAFLICKDAKDYCIY